MTEARRNIPSFSTVTSTFRSYILSLPLLTTTISCVAIVLYAFGALLFNENPIYAALSLKPADFFQGQVWRLLTYPYTHSYLGHLLFNLLVFLPLSTAIEHTIGTLEYSYVLITIFTVLSGSIYLLGSLIFPKEVEIGGLSTWIFGVVVWESRELAGSEREIFGLFRVPSHFYPFVLFLLMEIIFRHEWFGGYLCGLFVGYFYSFGYLTRILPASDFFSNLESKPPLSNLVNIRGFVKAADGRRGGWWLPLWNDDSIEDPLETPMNNTSNAGEQNQTNDTIQVPRSSSPDPHSTPVFVVPSSNTTRSNSPAPENTLLTTDQTTSDQISKEKD
ncbi:rhomboid-like protein 15 isoform X2 [Gigaspora margarita]|uniref:Rhomboid-like protein 15 isoform X2 n=1 Tax=Gigaspora margarita TaxID=4874 RepID=A0A8H4ADG3_GIGMA|nr:rhomboid-like protein 15 isoform X2 [Gigaspora margarita]